MFVRIVSRVAEAVLVSVLTATLITKGPEIYKKLKEKTKS